LNEKFLLPSSLDHEALDRREEVRRRGIRY